MDKLMAELSEPEKEYVKYAFKGTRVLIGQSVENVSAGVLDFRILHRFGLLNSGINNLGGLDQAYIRLGLDYGITDNLMVGLGRSGASKEIDGYIKWKFLKQATGKKSFPLTAAVVGGMVVDTKPFANQDRINFNSSRLSYFYQLIIGRKFNDRFSFQLSPTLVHQNLVASSADKNDIFGLGMGGRIKLTNRLTFNADYFFVPSGQIVSTNYQNALAIGFDIETGGHVFQLQLTNALGMNEKSFMTQTTGDWLKGDIHFGFNISRVFTLKAKKEFKEAQKKEW